jgi:hypothetical protein
MLLSIFTSLEPELPGSCTYLRTWRRVDEYQFRGDILSARWLAVEMAKEPKERDCGSLSSSACLRHTNAPLDVSYQDEYLALALVDSMLQGESSFDAADAAAARPQPSVLCPA